MVPYEFQTGRRRRIPGTRLIRHGNVIDAWSNTPRQQSDISFGLGPDGQAAYLTELTPEEPNARAVPGAPWRTRSFSVDRGYFDQPFEVEILSASEDVEIRYTLDGSQPTATPAWSTPVRSRLTRRRTSGPRHFKPGYLPTDVDTHTYIFVKMSSSNPPEIPGFPTAVALGRDRVPTCPRTARWIPSRRMIRRTGTSSMTHCLAIPTMSITSDPEQIFLRTRMVRRRGHREERFGGDTLSRRFHSEPSGRCGHRIALARSVEAFIAFEFSRSLRQSLHSRQICFSEILLVATPRPTRPTRSSSAAATTAVGPGFGTRTGPPTRSTSSIAPRRCAMSGYGMRGNFSHCISTECTGVCTTRWSGRKRSSTPPTSAGSRTIGLR